jgi:ABC-2 type transport system ATP-binding protein
VSALNKVYPSGLQALEDVDLDIARGEIFALLGPNGAGKTTLINIICGIAMPSAGTVRVAGHDNRADYRAARGRIGLVPQELFTDAFESVWATVSFSRGLFGKPPDPAHLEKVLRDLSLWDKRNDRIMTLSGGMKRRVMIAKALAHEPRLLFLDEPTAGVDVELRDELWEYIRKLHADGTTILLTTHYLEEAENLCRHIAIIDEGRIIEHDRMATVLRKLHNEVFVLNLRQPPAGPVELDGYDCSMTADGSLEVEVSKEQNLNDLFAALSARGIEVVSMRNKTNRLEELFMRLVEGRDAATGQSRPAVDA